MRQDLPFWDEAYYLENVNILNDLGFTKDFLIKYKGPAGPTYAVIHYCLNPITGFEVPGVRLVNLVFLAFTIYIICLTLKKLNRLNGNHFPFAITALSIPTVYTIAGMALTEMFAIFFLSIFIYLLVYVYFEMKYFWCLGIIAGFSLSFAILARQPILMVLFALPVFLFEKNIRFRINLPPKGFIYFLVLSSISASILPLMVFSIWGDIQPVSQAATGVGFAPKHLMLALGYSAIYSFFLNPSFFRVNNKEVNMVELLLIGLLTILLNIFLLKVSFIPFASLVSNILPEGLVMFYGLCCGCFLTTVGLLFVYYFLKAQLIEWDKINLFLSIGFLLIVATSIKVTHQFSPRYVSQAFPLILLAVNHKRRDIETFDILILLIGGILGIISLDSYFIS